MNIKSVLLKVLYGGLWKRGSGYTIGEEDEQVFSYLSRTGVTTKHMSPERMYKILCLIIRYCF